MELAVVYYLKENLCRHGEMMMNRKRSSFGGEPDAIMAKLKAETGSDHAAMEALPYFSALIEHRLPLESYVSPLSALCSVHMVLENELDAATDARIAAVWHEGLKKRGLLEEDLAFFAPRVSITPRAGNVQALNITEKIRLRRRENPLTLLGYLYVMEGSTLGNRMHRPDISATFHLGGSEECRYYDSYGEMVSAKWRQFSDTMNSALSDPDDGKNP